MATVNPHSLGTNAPKTPAAGGGIFARAASFVTQSADLFATSSEAYNAAKIRADAARAGYVPAGSGAVPEYRYADPTRNAPVTGLGNIPPMYLYIGAGLLLFSVLRKK